MKKRSKKTVLTISIITGIVTFIFYMWLSMPSIKLRINTPVTEEHYNMLKENALNYAKTLDERVIENKNIIPDFDFEDNKLIVSVESSTAKVTAKIPISNSEIKVEEGKISWNGTANYEEITYIGEAKMPPIWVFLVFSVAVGFLFAFTIYSGFCRKKEK